MARSVLDDLYEQYLTPHTGATLEGKSNPFIAPPSAVQTPPLPQAQTTKPLSTTTTPAPQEEEPTVQLAGPSQALSPAASSSVLSSASTASLGPVGQGGSMAPYRAAIANIESGGNYSQIGPVTATGDQALGKYQVMQSNLPQWSLAAVGRVVSPQEFLANPQIQDAVFDHRFGSYLKSYPPADAASMWFTGRPLATGGRAADQLGTTGNSYAAQFMANLRTAQTNAAPSRQGGPMVFGDSLGAGLLQKGLQGNASVGRPPADVLSSINSLPDGSLAGKPIILSSGASNDVANVGLASDQIKALIAKGASPENITLLGVGDRPDFQKAQVNAQLQSIAGATGVKFQSIDPAILGPDRVHPNYDSLMTSLQ